MEPLGNNLQWNSIQYTKIKKKKKIIHIKILFAKWVPFCSGHNVLIYWGLVIPHGDIDLSQYWHHYLNHCWFIISEVLWHSPEMNFIASAETTILYNEFENCLLKLLPHFSELKWQQAVHVSLSTLCGNHAVVCGKYFVKKKNVLTGSDWEPLLRYLSQG